MQQSLNLSLMTEPLISNSMTAKATALKEMTRLLNRRTRRALIRATQDQMTSEKGKAESQLHGHLREEVAFTLQETIYIPRQI